MSAPCPTKLAGWTRVARQRAFATLVLLLPLALDTAAHAQAKPSITLQLDRARVSLSDEVTLVVEIRGEVDGLSPPDLSEFDIAGQRTERRIDVGRSATFSQVYTLRPKKAGTFQIGPAQATQGGRVVAVAQPVTLVVEAPKPVAPVPVEEALSLEGRAEDAAFIRWDVPRTTFYVGEPFALTLQLWIRTELNASSPELVQQPKLDGLLVEDLKIDPSRGAERKSLGRATFDVYPLTAQLATPLRAGKLLVDATTIRIAVSQGGFLAAQRRTTLSTPPFHLDIREVPDEGRPAGFSARNIGQFTLSAKLVDERGAEASRARTGQRLILRAEVKGQGNLVALEPPRLVGEGAKAFEISPLSGNADDRVEKSLAGVSGTRIFQWIVSANAPGNLTTPGLALPTFDPVTRRFVTLEAPGRPLEVSGAAITPEADQASALGEDVGPIFETASLEGPSVALPRAPLYWSALALPLIGFLVVEWRHRRNLRDRRNPGARAARDAAHNARKRLRAAEQALKDGLVKDFYGQLARTLASYLEERANIPATGMTHPEVRQAARAAGYPAELVDAWVVEMENCDFARFAPAGSAADKMREAASRVSALVDALDKITPERRP